MFDSIQIDSHLSWNFLTNITEENQEAMINQTLIRAPFTTLSLTAAKRFNEYMKNSQDEDLKRIFGRLALGTINRNEEDLKNTSQLQAQLEDIYATTEVCESNDPDKCYSLSPDLERIMQIESDYDRLLWAWKGWHDSCGNKVRPVYVPYINLLNKNAKDNGYEDLSVSVLNLLNNFRIDSDLD